MEEDRISQLPDDILLLILDKTDIFEAVKTTILSNRWKNLWYLLSGLRFNLSIAAGHCRINPENSFLRSKLVSQLLSHREAAAPIHDFHLSFDSKTYRYYVDTKFMEKCVHYAINHGVQSLRLHAQCSIILTEEFISCKTLRELELRPLSSLVEVAGRLKLPNLKTLHLETYLVFYDDDVSMDPFSGLPELEKLTLINFVSAGFVIKAPKLRVLEISTSSKVKEIHTPLLTSFRYESDLAWECANVNLPMLENVYLDIHETRYVFNFVHGNFIRMLHQFGNAATVSLTLDTLKVLERNGGPFEQTPSLFPKMKCLKVMEGRNRIRTVFRGVMKYLTGPLYCEVELPRGVVVVEHISDENKDDYENIIADSEDIELYSDGDEDITLCFDYSDNNEDIELLYSDEDEDMDFT